MRSISTTVCSLLALTFTIWGIALSDASARGAPERITFFGDSIVAGYGLSSQKEALPQQLDRVLQHNASATTVMIPMGLSGDTTSNAISRVPDVLAQKPNIVILAFGGNDMLRGIDPDITYNNLEVILREFQRAGVYVLFCGMKAPPSLGEDYQSRFDHVFPELAERHQVTFYPFLLDGVFGNRMFMQRDGLHPSKEGAVVIARKLAPIISEMMNQLKTARKEQDKAMDEAEQQARLAARIHPSPP